MIFFFRSFEFLFVLADELNREEREIEVCLFSMGLSQVCAGGNSFEKKRWPGNVLF
jgi:hypothetical protein